MDYLEVTIEVNSEFAEIIIAELAEIGFDTFLENDNGLQAYVLEEDFEERAFKSLMEEYSEKTSLFYSLKGIEKQNWNAEWEKSFEPITVNDQVRVRATFHEASSDFPYEIVITPKMSFGTGHHETTSQIMALQLETDHQGKSVLDVGTGTGILAILAEKLGASEVRAFDIDEWSVENTEENIELNDAKNISVGLGTIANEQHQEYDIVIANINRNILLSEMNTYAEFLKPGGTLMLSGFYEKDSTDIESECSKHQLKKTKLISKKNWAAVVFKKDEL
ncbi:50S ribosomal protein L11 methyltransferase [Jiulongibacter sp. NS-SX5]|uniref:50S ribosomal protein L11 methyltransferase n=1 Tax=Jiulongibacter sp. NS-SX5 TaxID=3463854 RepID=UPI004059B30C